MSQLSPDEAADTPRMHPSEPPPATPRSGNGNGQHDPPSLEGRVDRLEGKVDAVIVIAQETRDDVKALARRTDAHAKKLSSRQTLTHLAKEGGKALGKGAVVAAGLAGIHHYLPALFGH